MKKLIIAAILAFSVVFGSCSTFAHTPANIVQTEQIYQKIEAASVMIVMKLKDGATILIGSGTCVGVDEEGRPLILTARHCLEAMMLRVEGESAVAPNYQPGVMFHGNFLPGTITMKFKFNWRGDEDFGYMALDLAPALKAGLKHISLSTQHARLGEAILANPHFPWQFCTIMRGWVSAIHPDKTMMVVDIDGTPGVSGSAVCIIRNGQPYVVGVLVSVVIYQRDPTIPVAGTTMTVVVVNR